MVVALSLPGLMRVPPKWRTVLALVLAAPVMLLVPKFLLFLTGGLVVLFSYFASRPISTRWLPFAITVGAYIGIARATFASVGVLAVERADSPIAIMSIPLVYLAWPEFMLFRAYPGAAPAAFFGKLALTLIGTSTVLAVIVALAAHLSGRRKGE